MNQESGIDNVLVLDASFDHPSFDQQSKCLYLCNFVLPLFPCLG